MSPLKSIIQIFSKTAHFVIKGGFKKSYIIYDLCGTLRSWGHLRPKISLVPFCMKTQIWRLKSSKMYSLMTKNTKKCRKVVLKDFFAFSSPMAEKNLVNFHPICVLFGGYFNHVGSSICSQISELA